MLEFLQYPFMLRAFAAGLILSGLLALLGNFVVLKKMAFFSDGLAHISLAGIAIGILTSLNPLIIALVFCLLSSLVIYFLEKKYNISSDAIIGILFTSSMALGVLLISFKPGYQPELISFLFGNILSVNNTELWISFIISFLVLIFLARYFKNLTLLSLDSEMAYLSGIKAEYLQPALYIILSVAIVLGIKILGVILVSALLIIPAVTAKLLSRSFKTLILLGFFISEITVFLGISLSYYLNLPPGPVIVLTGAAFFLITLIFKKLNEYEKLR